MKKSDQYEAKPQTYFAHSRPEMLAFVPTTATRVLEVGCGRGLFAAALKDRSPVHVTAIEPFPEAAQEAKTRVDRLIMGSVENGLQELASESFDCVIFNDVLEHLIDPWAVLTQIRTVLGSDGKVVISLPNVRYFPVLKELVLRGNWRYQDEGVMDITHLRFFTKKSIVEMFCSLGYRTKSIEGINPRDTWKLSALNFLTLQKFEDTRFQQFAGVFEQTS